MGPIKIIGHFVLHVILGSILFLVLAAAAVVIKLALDWLAQKGMPDELVHVAHYVEMFVFAVDVICFIFFVVVEAVVLCREILNEAKTPTVVGVAEGVPQK